MVTDTTGILGIQFDRGLTEAHFRVDISGGEAITQAHLHCGTAGSNGPVVAFLFNVAPVAGPGGVSVDGELATGTLTNPDILPQACGPGPQHQQHRVASGCHR